MRYKGTANEFFAAMPTIKIPLECKVSVVEDALKLLIVEYEKTIGTKPPKEVSKSLSNIIAIAKAALSDIEKLDIKEIEKEIKLEKLKNKDNEQR